MIFLKEKTEEETLLLLNNTEECFVLIDKELKIVSFNKQFQKNCQSFFNKQALKGDCTLDFSQKNKEVFVKNIYKRVLAGETIDDEIAVPFKDNNIIVFSISYKPVVDDIGNIIGIFVTSKNITDKKKLEHHLRLLESVITNTNDSIMITEAEPFDEPGPKIVYVNDAFTKNDKVFSGRSYREISSYFTGSKIR